MTTTRPRPILRFARGPRRTASDEVPTLRLAEAPSPEAPRRKASDEVPILRLSRGLLGNDPVTAASTDFSDKTSRPINASNHSRNVSRTTAQYSEVADGTGDRTGQGLPTTVLGTVPITDARTALCYLIPAPGTARHGESSPGHYSLGISV